MLRDRRILTMTSLMFLFISVYTAYAGVGANFYSNYIWRGTKLGTGPAVQPYVEANITGITAGSWGSFCITGDEAAEADIYLSYRFDFGLSIGLTDYYYPGSSYFEFSDTTSSHAHEINLGYETGNLSFSANYILNDASSGAGSAGGDMYFELGYTIGSASLFIGAGDGWHTTDGKMNICNVGVITEKSIKINEDFSLPMTGSVILNPEAEQFYVVAGLSF